MQLNELKALYRDACKSLRKEPEEAEFKMWKSVLGDLEERDVRGALTAWWASERGAFLPKPAELKPECKRLARIRRYAETPDYCGECACGWLSKMVNGKPQRVPCHCLSRVNAAKEARKAEPKLRGGGAVEISSEGSVETVQLSALLLPQNSQNGKTERGSGRHEKSIVEHGTEGRNWASDMFDRTEAHMFCPNAPASSASVRKGDRGSKYLS